MTDDYRLVVRRPGGPDAIEREAIGATALGSGEARIRHQAIGLNFIDTYHRSGLYPLTMPSGIGVEAAGIVEEIGPGVVNVARGDRIAYAGPIGAYATTRIISADRLVRLPNDIGSEQAAAIMLKGMTADMLVGACAGIEPGQAALVHSAAGGVGSLLVPWLKAVGVFVIAHAGTAEKAARAIAAGADVGLCCPFAELAAAVRETTEGRGVDVVYDGVGAASWEATLEATAKRGLIVSFGNASGPVAPITPLDLGRRGSLFMTRPSLFDYIATQAELHASAGRLFAMIRRGKLTIDIGQRFPLADAAEAHRALERRATTGSTLLIP